MIAECRPCFIEEQLSVSDEYQPPFSGFKLPDCSRSRDSLEETQIAFSLLLLFQTFISHYVKSSVDCTSIPFYSSKIWKFPSPTTKCKYLRLPSFSLTWISVAYITYIHDDGFFTFHGLGVHHCRTPDLRPRY
jgi:hypothetical protein